MTMAEVRAPAPAQAESTPDEAEGIDLYIQYLEAQAAGRLQAAKRLLQASVALGEPMALHAAAYQQKDIADAVSLYTRAADAGFAPSAWNLYLHYDALGDGGSAALWLKRAAALGDTDAVKLLTS
jgi:hypothetical protein